MLRSNERAGRTSVRNKRVVLVLLLVCIVSGSSSVAYGDIDSWLDWLFVLFGADRVPDPPTLTEEDRVAIEKARVLLQDYAPDPSNRMMLGVLAAASRNEAEASKWFKEAHELDTSKSSLLPLTMAAQTHMQEGSFQRAKSLHRRVVTQSRERGAPVSQKVNAHLDLAVACARLNEPNEAAANAERAVHLIDTGELTASERTLGYLQAGVVFQQELKNDGAALTVWKRAEVLGEAPDAAVSPRLTLEVNLKLIQSLPAETLVDSLDRYLGNVQRAAGRLPEEESRVSTRARVGEQLAWRALDSRDTPPGGLLASRAKAVLRPVWKMDLKDRDTTIVRAKAQAIRAARGLARSENDKETLAELENEAKQLRRPLVIERFLPLEPRVPAIELRHPR